MKVKMDIIVSITASPIVYTVIMFVETFKTDVIVFYRYRHTVFDVTVTDDLQYHGQTFATEYSPL